jgi:hypothetical protein
LNYLTPSSLHQLEHLRSFTPDVADKRRLNFLGMTLQACQQLMQ